MVLRFSGSQFSVLSCQLSGLVTDGVVALRGEEDGEHGHEPEGKAEVEVLGVGETADQGEEEEAGGEGFEMPGSGAANLAEEDPVERDGENDSDGPEGEE